MVGTAATRWSSGVLTAALLVAGLFLQGPGRPDFVVNVIFLVVFFFVPALGVHSPRALRERWLPMLVTMIVGTLAWDVSTAFFARSRPLLSEWALVYTTGPAMLMGLHLGQAALASTLARWLDNPEESPT